MPYRNPEDRKKKQPMGHRAWLRDNDPAKYEALKLRERNKMRALRAKDPETTRRKQRDQMRQYTARIMAEVFEHYGDRCSCCGETEMNFLTIDHVNGDGAEHRRAVAGTKKWGGRNLYMWLRKHGYPDGFQLLCWNCNCGRQRTGGICPHKVLG